MSCITYPVWVYLEAGKVEFKARQVSLLWHNSFLDSLSTFQLTRVDASKL